MTPLLTVNVGSSSIRLNVFDIGGHTPARLGGRKYEAWDHDPGGVLSQFLGECGLDRPAAVAHRIVHGGTALTRTQWIGDDAEAEIARLGALAPLHNPRALRWLWAARAAFGEDVPQIGVFDTAFFADLPAVAARYALPPELAEANGIRRYGFHGLAHAFMWRRWTHLGPAGAADARILTLQLGGGCSTTATAAGRPVDTSMGFTPAEGLVMATRPGDLDPNVLLHLHRHAGMDWEALDKLLNGGSGLKAMAGTADLRDLLKRNNAAARDAVDLYCYRIRKYIGAYLAALGGAEAIVFGGGVGENAPAIRRRVLEGMTWCGIRLDDAANDATVGTEACISAADSTVALWVVPVDEAALMAEEADHLLRTTRQGRQS